MPIHVFLFHPGRVHDPTDSATISVSCCNRSRDRSPSAEAMSTSPTVSNQIARPARNPLAPPKQASRTAPAKSARSTPFDSTTHHPPPAPKAVETARAQERGHRAGIPELLPCKLTHRTTTDPPPPPKPRDDAPQHHSNHPHPPYPQYPQPNARLRLAWPGQQISEHPLLDVFVDHRRARSRGT